MPGRQGESMYLWPVWRRADAYSWGHWHKTLKFLLSLWEESSLTDTPAICLERTSSATQPHLANRRERTLRSRRGLSEQLGGSWGKQSSWVWQAHLGGFLFFLLRKQTLSRLSHAHPMGYLSYVEGWHILIIQIMLRDVSLVYCTLSLCLTFASWWSFWSSLFSGSYTTLEPSTIESFFPLDFLNEQSQLQAPKHII